jgi:hypothetical protein
VNGERVEPVSSDQKDPDRSEQLQPTLIGEVLAAAKDGATWVACTRCGFAYRKGGKCDHGAHATPRRRHR